MYYLFSSCESGERYGGMIRDLQWVLTPELHVSGVSMDRNCAKIVFPTRLSVPSRKFADKVARVSGGWSQR